MTQQSLIPFFSPKVLFLAQHSPVGSPEWTDAINIISRDIKAFEAFIKSVKTIPFDEFSIGDNLYSFVDYDKGAIRLFSIIRGFYRPAIELPASERIKAYEDIPKLIEFLEKSQIENDNKTIYTDKQTLLKVLMQALRRSKEQFGISENAVGNLRKLKELRATAPSSNESIRNKFDWFKDFANTLLSIKFVEPAIQAIKDEIPKIWNQLTFKQKLQLASLGPIIGAGAFVGGVGIAGLGNAVGLPTILVIIVLLFLTNGLIDFLDFCIGLIGDTTKINPDYENLKKSFDFIFNQGLQEIFKGDFNPKNSQETTDSFNTTENIARDYEFFAVNKLAQEFQGKGFVTSQSRDSGIDGYIICNDSKEVILVQTKHYANRVGFAEATQYLGTLFFWQKEFSNKFEYPITKMILAGPNDFSIEAKRVAGKFENSLILKTIKYSPTK